MKNEGVQFPEFENQLGTKIPVFQIQKEVETLQDQNISIRQADDSTIIEEFFTLESSSELVDDL